MSQDAFLESRNPVVFITGIKKKKKRTLNLNYDDVIKPPITLIFLVCVKFQEI